MERIIKAVTPEKMGQTLDFVERVFTDSEDAENARIVRNLVAEIRASENYVPALDLIMVDEHDEVIGHVMFSRFHIEDKYKNELLLLTPVSVKTELQRRHISKELIEYGFDRARELGYRLCMVEGNPQNYRARGFVTSANYGVYADESVGLPHVDCLLIKELVPGALEGVGGYVNYSMYEALK